ncbi:MAG: hypothetical protein IJI27_04705 [Oscillospiraceae bacterium]|nr:hypothetical protein [Oscillospiraceae bacterium]
MLGKLMKYDLRSCLRKFGPLWAAMLALSVVTGLYFRFIHNAPERGLLANLLTALLPTVLIGLFVAMGVMALVFIIQRFYKGLLGDEGYLMFTLPASAGAHIASKGLTALILELVSGLVAFISALLLILVFQPEEMSRGWREFALMLRQFDFSPATPWLIGEGLLLSLVAAAAETLKIYSAISLGHLGKKHRALWALLAYLGIDLAINILVGIGVSSGLLSRFFGSGLQLFTDGGALTAGATGLIAGSFGSLILWYLLLGTGFFFLTRFILKNHLNLE